VLDAAHAKAREELLFELLPLRRLRSHPRGVKRKMTSYHLKSPAHRVWPQPTLPPDQAIKVLVK
jgi:hypothetical protein